MFFEGVIEYFQLLFLSYVWATFTLSAIAVRKKLEVEGQSFEGNEFKTFATHLFNVFGGGMLANLLSGLSPLNDINVSYLMIATMVW
jgi:hypothetical protein